MKWHKKHQQIATKTLNKTPQKTSTMCVK